MKGGMMQQETKSIVSEEAKSTAYCLELPSLWYDREYLIDHLKNIDNDSWYEFDCGHIRWTVHEAFNPRLECKNYKWSEFHLELAMLFNPPITPDTMLYTSTPIGGTPPHQDRNRPAVLNFAVRGEFGDSSPQTFYEDFDRSTLSYTMPYTKSNITNEFSPWMFKGPKIHGVNNENDANRTIITTCWRHNSYEDIVERLKNGTLINQEQNDKNKRIKFIGL
jgi:hypothetical protein